MIKIDKHTKKQLLNLYKTRKICLEGNILKLIDTGDDDDNFKEYIEEAIKRDKESRRKRLDVTKKVQVQNTDLTKLNKENKRVNRQLTKALEEAEILANQAIKSKDEAEVARVEAESARVEAETAKAKAENARTAVENDLEILQKKTQFELIGTIVNVALWIIIGVGVITTLMYLLTLWMGGDTSDIFNTWSNIIGILLTNAFSIVGTIMGVKYASGKSSKEE